MHRIPLENVYAKEDTSVEAKLECFALVGGFTKVIEARMLRFHAGLQLALGQLPLFSCHKNIISSQ